MLETKAGEFVLLSSEDGYPHWGTLSYGEMEICNIHHLELADLEYVVKRYRELLKFKTQNMNKGDPI